MLKGFGLVFISILVGGGVLTIDKIIGTNFAVNFAKGQSIGVLATIFALNVATATFLVGGLLNVEEKLERSLFDGPRREIKHNLYAMGILFLINLFVVAAVGNPNFYVFSTGIKLDDVLALTAVSILVFYLYLIIEIVRAVFNIKFTKK